MTKLLGKTTHLAVPTQAMQGASPSEPSGQAIVLRVEGDGAVLERSIVLVEPHARRRALGVHGRGERRVLRRLRFGLGLGLVSVSGSGEG